VTTVIEIEDAMSEPKKFTTVHSRFQVVCSCCGLVESYAKKREAMRKMIDHMEQHPVTETETFAVYDLMAKGGGRTKYGGRIHNGIRSHGIGVGYSVDK
jgi:hypothetical protein